MKKVLLTFVGVVLALSACTSLIEEDKIYQEASKEYTLRINVEMDNTKAAVNDGSFHWTKGDQKSVD